MIQDQLWHWLPMLHHNDFAIFICSLNGRKHKRDPFFLLFAQRSKYNNVTFQQWTKWIKMNNSWKWMKILDFTEKCFFKCFIFSFQLLTFFLLVFFTTKNFFFFDSLRLEYKIKFNLKLVKFTLTVLHFLFFFFFFLVEWRRRKKLKKPTFWGWNEMKKNSLNLRHRHLLSSLKVLVWVLVILFFIYFSFYHFISSLWWCLLKVSAVYKHVCATQHRIRIEKKNWIKQNKPQKHWISSFTLRRIFCVCLSSCFTMCRNATLGSVWLRHEN